MQNFSKLAVIIFLGLVFVVSACSRITQQNFDKIQPGMTMEQVRQILGEPINVESINVAGISGSVAIWKDHDASITIHFLNNVVTIKTFFKNIPENKQAGRAQNIDSNTNH